MGKVLTVGPVARILQVGEEAVRSLADSGKLPSTRTILGHRIFDERDVKRFAAEREERRRDAR